MDVEYTRRPISVALAREDSNQDNPPTTAARTAAPPFELAFFKQFLGQLVQLLIGSSVDELDALFESSNFADTATKWAGDPSAMVVYVVRTRDEVDEQDGDVQGMSTSAIDVTVR